MSTETISAAPQAEATPPAVTNEQLAAKVVEAVTAVQDAEETVVNEGKRLTTHMADPNAHGADVGACIAQAVADHEGNDAAHGALKAVLEAQIAGKAEQGAVDVVFAAIAAELAAKADSAVVTVALDAKASSAAVTAVASALEAKADRTALEDLAQRVEQGGGASMDVQKVFYFANTGGF